MRNIRSNNLRFLTTIIVAICLMAAPALQAATLYNQSEKSATEFSCCCYPEEKEDNSCLIREDVLEDDCSCKVELSEPTIPAPFTADVQSKFELNQNSDICDATIANRLSDKPTLVFSDNLIKTVNSPPLYISNSAFLL